MRDLQFLVADNGSVWLIDASPPTFVPASLASNATGGGGGLARPESADEMADKNIDDIRIGRSMYIWRRQRVEALLPISAPTSSVPAPHAPPPLCSTRTAPHTCVYR